MNYKLIFFGFLFMAVVPASAQVGESRNNWSVGVNGGMNLNKVSFDPKIKQNMQNGITGGITARYICEKYFAMICGIQAELNFAQRGWDEKIEENTNTYKRVMNYIEFPFMAHLAFGKEPRGVQFFVNAGPQLGYLISEKERYGTEGGWNTDQRPGGVIQQYGKMADKKFDYGIVAGAGIELKTQAGNFLLEGRYYFGLADFYNNSKRDIFGRSAHTTISIRLSYLIDLTR